MGNYSYFQDQKPPPTLDYSSIQYVFLLNILYLNYITKLILAQLAVHAFLTEYKVRLARRHMQPQFLLPLHQGCCQIPLVVQNIRVLTRQNNLHIFHIFQFHICTQGDNNSIQSYLWLMYDGQQRLCTCKQLFWVQFCRQRQQSQYMHHPPLIPVHNMLSSQLIIIWCTTRLAQNKSTLYDQNFHFRPNFLQIQLITDTNLYTHRTNSLYSCILRHKYLHISGKSLSNIFKYFSIIAPTGTPQKRFYCPNDLYFIHCTSIHIHLIQHMMIQVFALKSLPAHGVLDLFRILLLFQQFLYLYTLMQILDLID
ncbi:Transmembrane domain-containing protein [Spironucleus salmonicida]|uniref:Transmembrane domain-containing protein n=1 Tax=Spironucleus salmonicida TaxID=348837 RepID=V6LNS6_9EUKA|nr:Transmembrane domain-containing protein [Spironucleus salmonicida]|eukprot:EST45371.1 Transmembrane domain-containing protein [Spironucleus salmonicida]